MRPIHVSTPEGSSTSHSREELQELWQQGKIDPEALYFLERSREWRPIQELFGETVSPRKTSLFKVGEPLARYQFTKDPATLTLCLQVMLCASLAATTYSLLCDFLQLDLTMTDNPTLEIAEANDSRQALAGLGVLGTFVATAITFVMWVYRANVNCRGFGASGMEFTPGWAAGWYFFRSPIS